MLPKKTEMLAFDLGDEDDEFAIGTNVASSGQPTLTSDKTESKEYIGLSRKNYQQLGGSDKSSDDEAGSDEDDRHFKRRS